MALLGIDIGSTALKAAAFDSSGRQLAVTRRTYRGAEQGGLSWWRTTARSVRELVSHIPPDTRIEAIGLSGRGGTSVLLDSRNRPLAPDQLALPASDAAFARAVELAGGMNGIHGTRFLARLIDRYNLHPERLVDVARAMAAKDYVLYRLTGAFFTDPASSVGESWPAGVTASEELRSVRLPEVRWPWALAGPLQPDAAKQLGLPAGLPVAVGAHDGAAATIGVGAASPGRHSVTLGTNTVYRIVAEGDARSDDRFWWLLPGVMVYGADVTLGGYALDWAASLFGRRKPPLEREAASIAPGSEGVTFLPQLAGRMLPSPNPDATATFSGMERWHRAGHLFRAVLEGNAFGLRAIREALLADGSLEDGPICLTGGGAVSDLWRQMLADVFQRPVHWSGIEDGCRGAAVFAAVAAGMYMNITEAIEAMTQDVLMCEPSEASPLYEAPYARFQPLRGALDQA